MMNQGYHWKELILQYILKTKIIQQSENSKIIHFKDFKQFPCSWKVTLN